eukprot:3522418-Pyramimonas_sp.AAC.1
MVPEEHLQVIWHPAGAFGIPRNYEAPQGYSRYWRPPPKFCKILGGILRNYQEPMCVLGTSGTRRSLKESAGLRGNHQESERPFLTKCAREILRKSDEPLGII